MSTSSADFNAQIIEQFHANPGRVGGIFERAPLLLLHHTGAKSDKNRVNLLGYHSDGGRSVVCLERGAPRRCRARLVTRRRGGRSLGGIT